MTPAPDPRTCTYVADKIVDGIHNGPSYVCPPGPAGPYHYQAVMAVGLLLLAIVLVVVVIAVAILRTEGHFSTPSENRLAKQKLQNERLRIELEHEAALAKIAADKDAAQQNFIAGLGLE